MSHLVDNDLDYFLCDDCGAAFSVFNEIFSTGYVKRTISPTNMLFRGVCTACGSPRIFADPAADYEDEDPADSIAPNENEEDDMSYEEMFERSAAFNDINDMIAEMRNDL